MEEEASRVLSGVDVRLYRRPIVYAWKRGDEWLYVGLGTRGATRFFDWNHHRIKTIEIENDDVFLVWDFDTAEDAVDYEGGLISRTQPILNEASKNKILPTHCEGCGKMLLKTRWWQRYCGKDCRKATNKQEYEVGLKHVENTEAEIPVGKPVISVCCYCGNECENTARFCNQDCKTVFWMKADGGKSRFSESGEYLGSC